MVQKSVRIIDHQLSGGSHLHTIVNIVKGHCQLLCKASHFLEQALLAHHAGGRHSAVVLGAHSPVEIAVLRLVQSDKGVAGNAAESYDHAGVLNGVVLVQQSGPHHAHVVSLAQSQHLLNETRLNRLRIVI